MSLQILFDFLFPTPSPPSWGEEVEYQYHYHMVMDDRQLSIDKALDGHHDGSGPWELTLPPANIHDYQYIHKISAVLSNLQFPWGQYGYDDVYDLDDYTYPEDANEIEEPYGMGRHLHYKPPISESLRAFANFLDRKVFDRSNHIVMLALTPFLTPNTEAHDNEIGVYFRESLSRWALFTSWPTTDHYAYININEADSLKPITIELRHNEAHPYEAYAFIILFHYLLSEPVTFSVNVDGDVHGHAVIKIDDREFEIYDWNRIVVPVNTFWYVVNKIAEAISDRRLRKHVYDVYQNILQNKRIFYNDDVAKLYPSKTYENTARRINDLIEDAYANNLAVYADINKIEIDEYDNVILYAKMVEIRAKKRVLRTKISRQMRVRANVFIAPSPSDKAGKFIRIS